MPSYLKKGGQLLLKGEADEPKLITITNITVETKHQTTYNLEVANAHTFFALEDGVLVHNQKCRADRKKNDKEVVGGHRKGKRKSTKDTHEKGDRRRGKDQGGEKGDARRLY